MNSLLFTVLMYQKKPIAYSQGVQHVTLDRVYAVLHRPGTEGFLLMERWNSTLHVEFLNPFDKQQQILNVQNKALFGTSSLGTVLAYDPEVLSFFPKRFPIMEDGIIIFPGPNQTLVSRYFPDKGPVHQYPLEWTVLIPYNVYSYSFSPRLKQMAFIGSSVRHFVRKQKSYTRNETKRDRIVVQGEICVNSLSKLRIVPESAFGLSVEQLAIVDENRLAVIGYLDSAHLPSKSKPVGGTSIFVGVINMATRRIENGGLVTSTRVDPFFSLSQHGRYALVGIAAHEAIIKELY